MSAQPVAVGAVDGDRGRDRLLEEIGGLERLPSRRYVERGQLVEEALPVALDAVELRLHRRRRELAAERGVDRPPHLVPSVARLPEEVLELEDEGLLLGVAAAVDGDRDGDRSGDERR